jgi:hypothetical protein
MVTAAITIALTVPLTLFLEFAFSFSIFLTDSFQASCAFGLFLLFPFTPFLLIFFLLALNALSVFPATFLLLLPALLFTFFTCLALFRATLFVLSLAATALLPLCLLFLFAFKCLPLPRSFAFSLPLLGLTCPLLFAFTPSLLFFSGRLCTDLVDTILAHLRATGIFHEIVEHLANGVGRIFVQPTALDNSFE